MLAMQCIDEAHSKGGKVSHMHTSASASQHLTIHVVLLIRQTHTTHHCCALALSATDSATTCSHAPQVLSFELFCGGLPAPECADNPLKYKFRYVQIDCEVFRYTCTCAYSLSCMYMYIHMCLHINYSLLDNRISVSCNLHKIMTVTSNLIWKLNQNVRTVCGSK